MSATRERGARLGEAWTRVIGQTRLRAGRRRQAGRTRGAGLSWWAGRAHPRATLAAALVGLLVILGGFWLWFRDSPFVSISRVQVIGLSGPGIPQIRQALRGAAMRMSTLDVDMTRLRAAVDPYPVVKSLTVETQFPHGVVIHVNEEVPIAELSLGGRTLAVSRDGTLLPATPADSHLPQLPVAVLPAGNRLTQAGPRAALAVLAAAPYRFLGHVESVSQSAQNGLVAELRNGPQLRFGDTTQLHAKWAAALAVLGDSSSQGATYIDVSDPGRPAAGAPTTTTATSTTTPAQTPTADTTTPTQTPTSETTTPGTVPGTTPITSTTPG